MHPAGDAKESPAGGERTVTRRYRDPLDEIWLGTAQRIGLIVERVDDAYASTDGRGTLRIGRREHLDADDCLAQMIFHELCHSLIEGADSLEQSDWGLDRLAESDLTHEHACLRVQASLSAPWGLRDVLAPTTDHRAFFDTLSAEPVAPDDTSPQAVRARLGLMRAETAPWSPHLTAALDATARVLAVAREFVTDDTALSKTFTGLVPSHPAGGFVLLSRRDETCGTCAWAEVRGGKPRCQVKSKKVDAAWPACESWEPPVECQRCGACCREAYDIVELGPREPVLRKHPDLITHKDGRFELSRPRGRCVALDGGEPCGDDLEPTVFGCRIYEDRPRTCRDFQTGGAHCLTARRKVGLSR